MPSFPILKLPSLAQIQVLKVMNELDLLVFSLISKSSKNLSIAAGRSIIWFRWDLYWYYSDRFSCFLDHSTIVPMRKSVEEARESEHLELWKLNGQLVPMYRAFNDDRLVWHIGDNEQPREQSYQLMVQLSDHILEVFQCRVFKLRTCNPDALRDLFVMKHTRRFKSLIFGSLAEIPADNLKFVLEELEVEDLDLQAPVTVFHWNGPLRMKTLRVVLADWLTFEAVLNSECEYLNLDGTDFNETQLNTFIKKWLDGGLPNLQYCYFRCNVQSSFNVQFNIEAVLDGIQTIPYDPDRHPENHPRDDIRLDNAWELSVDVRRNDGVLATIIPTDRFVLAKWDN